MYKPDKRIHTRTLSFSTAMAAVMLSGCATNAAPRADLSAAQAQQAIINGEHRQAILAAEDAVMAEPRNAAYRMTLGNAYLEAGRFASASTSYEDAMALGENSPRAALSLALALTGQARYAEASAVLAEWEGMIAAADLGLALALAGQPERGIHILTNAIRSGDNTVKVRQNLAYAYAVAGRWRESRMMVAQDVPAHEVGNRMTEWAQMARADAYGARIASLLGVPANVRDTGQPVHLALANTPSGVELAVETETDSEPAFVAAPPAPAPVQASVANPAPVPAFAPVEMEAVTVPASGGELPAVGSPADDRYAQVRPQGASFARAFAEEAPSGGSLAAIAGDTVRFVGRPVVQATPPRDRERSNAARAERHELARPQLASGANSAPAPVAAHAPVPGPVSAPTHLVQLGSFSSEAGARRAWDIYQSRYPELADREMVITQAVVNGRNYWRVSAGGFDSASSRAMCNRVDAANGEGCISWAANSPLPGAIDRGPMRFARR